MNKISACAVIISVLLCSSHGYAAEAPCRQQYIFTASRQELLDIAPVPGSGMSNIEEKHFSASRTNYFTVKSDPAAEIRIYSGKENRIGIRVKGHAQRPLSARWINEKLIYFEVWFNPHSGAYWIYDVTDEKVVAHELQNDGWDAFQQCREHQKKGN